MNGTEWNQKYGPGQHGYVYDDNSLTKIYVDEYKDYLETFGVSINEARLISYEEIVDLGCSDSEHNCDDAPNWVYSTTYWTGDAGIFHNVYFITSYGTFENPSYFLTRDDFAGVRPVIVIDSILLNS